VPIKSQKWGRLPDGREAYLFEISNRQGMTVKLSNYGGTITAVLVPDKNGSIGDVVLGYDSLAEYITNRAFLGAMIGRFANRIRNASFSLNGKTYQLTRNNGENHIHGGLGFNHKLWDFQLSENGLVLSLSSPDGEEGYPGSLEVKIEVSLTDDNRLRLDYTAVSDQDTILNLSNHAYFNLAGAGQGDILGHEVKILADFYTPVDEASIPTGEIRPVQRSEFDFRAFRVIGSGMYDHNFVLNSGPGVKAEVIEKGSGRYLRLYTSMPGLQFYCGKNLPTGLTGKHGAAYPRFSGLCLETQYFPNSPNLPQFPSPYLKAGVRYSHFTEFEFGTLMA
jgi:aldose 1-epimerase